MDKTMLPSFLVANMLMTNKNDVLVTVKETLEKPVIKTGLSVIPEDFDWNKDITKFEKELELTKITMPWEE